MRPLAWAALAFPWSLLAYPAWKWIHGKGKAEEQAALAKRIRTDEYLQSAHRDLPEPIGRRRELVDVSTRGTTYTREFGR